VMKVKCGEIAIISASRAFASEVFDGLRFEPALPLSGLKPCTVVAIGRKLAALSPPVKVFWLKKLAAPGANFAYFEGICSERARVVRVEGRAIEAIFAVVQASLFAVYRHPVRKFLLAVEADRHLAPFVMNVRRSRGERSWSVLHRANQARPARTIDGT